MAISSGQATSRRGYLSQDELKQFANITIQDTAEADDIISQAEEMIDAYVGYVRKHFEGVVEGLVSNANSATTFTLESEEQNIYEKDFFVLCEVEIVGGTGAGERRKITGSTKAGVITVDADISLSTDSFYRIYQLGKFPRHEDVRLHTNNTYYKQIPEAVKRATAFQVEYLKEEGSEFFNTDKQNMQSESIGDYSYTRAGGATIDRLLAPRVKQILRGYRVRSGRILT